jgi:Fic family protein
MLKNRIAEVDILKKEIDQYRPLPAPILPMLKEYFRIGLTYSSNALEGNTLTETETKVILEDGLTIGGKTLNNTFSEQDVRELHRLFYNFIDQENAGEYHKVPVFVTGTDFEFPACAEASAGAVRHSFSDGGAKPTEVPTLMKEFLQELSSYKEKYHPVQYAALVHAKLVTIHPFIDGPPSLKLWRTAPAEASAKAGNGLPFEALAKEGRTTRLLMNLALLQSGYVITIIPPIMRSQYITTIGQANRGNMTPFFEFISEMVYESSKEYLRLIKSAVQ